MKIVHLLAGLGYASGVANIARRFARVQVERGDEVVLLAPSLKWNPIWFGLWFSMRALWSVWRAHEVWVHCSWTFPVWYGAGLARLFGKRLIVVPEGSFDPKRLQNHAGWKKRLVAPLDRWVLRVADEVLALCSDEAKWIGAFEPRADVREEKVPLFLGGERERDSGGDEWPCRNGERVEGGGREWRGTLRSPSASLCDLPSEAELLRRMCRNVERVEGGGGLHVLFLGRASDPLKGVRYLEQAVREVNSIELRIVSDHCGEELERDWAWCDVLCLPTLSENFGLVVAEALERGKRVITTDGAPAWGERGDEWPCRNVERVEGEGREEVEGGRRRGERGDEWPCRNVERVEGLVYLRGFREGTERERVELLKEALREFVD